MRKTQREIIGKESLKKRTVNADNNTKVKWSVKTLFIFVLCCTGFL